MKLSRKAPSVTSLPRAPQDDDRARVRTYTITMGIRMACFVLMVLVTPYGWYTWVFAAGAIFLPYIAVVVANAGRDSTAATAEIPARALEAPEAAIPEENPSIIEVQESGPDVQDDPA